MTVRAEIRPIPEPSREVVLTMPYDVAVSLYDLTLCVTGNPEESHRGDTDRIGWALRRAGVEISGLRFKGDVEAQFR